MPWIINSVVKYNDLTIASEFLPLNLDVIDFPVSWLSYSFSKVLNTSASYLFREQYRVPHLVVFYFIALCKYCVFYKWKIFGSPALSESIYWHYFFQWHLLTLCLCITFWWFSHYFKLLKWLVLVAMGNSLNTTTCQRLRW